MKKWLICILILVLSLSGCQARTESGDHYALNVLLSVRLYRVPSGTLDRLWQETDRLETLLSRTKDGDVGRLNAGETVTLSPETREVLELALRMAESSGGAFNPGLGTITELWGFSSNPHLPDTASLASALSLCNWEKITASETMSLPDGMKLDLGGIAKGYVGDCLAEMMKQYPDSAGFLDLGGNIVTFGENPKGGPWRIGVVSPFDEQELACTLSLEGSWAVVTSGTYERNFTQDGVFYHHLLDPETGYPVNNGLVSVTIVAKSSALADALSTACFVLGTQRGLILAQEYGAEALFIDADGNTAETQGFSDYRIS